MAVSDPLETSNDNDTASNKSESNGETENKYKPCMVNKNDKIEVLEMIETIDVTDDASVVSSGTSTSALIRATENSTNPNPNADRIKARLERRRKRAANKQKDVRIQVYSVSDKEENLNTSRRNEEDNDTSTVITAATAALTEASSCFDESFVLNNGEAMNTSAISSILDVSDTNNVNPDNSNIFSMAVDFLLSNKAEEENENGLESAMEAKNESRTVSLDENHHVTASEQDNDNENQTVATNSTSHSSKSVKTPGSEKSEGVEIVAEMEKFMCAADSWVANALGTSNAANNTLSTNESKWKIDANSRANGNNMSSKSTIDLDQKISPMARMRTKGGGTVLNETNTNSTTNVLQTTQTWDNQIQNIVNRLNDNQRQHHLLGTCESHESTDTAATEVTRNTSSSRVSKSTPTKLSNLGASTKMLEENRDALIASCQEQSDDFLKQLGIAEMIKNMFSADGSCATALANKQIYSDEDNEENESYSDDESSCFYDDESTHASTISEGSDESNSNRSSRSKSTKYSDSDNEENDILLEKKRHLMTQPPPPPPPKPAAMSSSSSSTKQRQRAAKSKNEVKNSRLSKYAGENTKSLTKGVHRTDSVKQKNWRANGRLESDEDDEIFVEQFIEEIVHSGISMIWHKVQTQSYQRPKQVTTSIEIGNCGEGTYTEPKLRWKIERAPNSIETDSYMKVDLFDIVAVEKAGVMNFHSYPFAIPSNSFFVSLSSGGSVLFEAKNPQEQQRIIRGLSQVVSRLTYNLIAGDIDICWDLFACSDNLQTEEIASENLTVEELDLWFISKAMNDVTHKLVDKSALQAKGVDEV